MLRTVMLRLRRLALRRQVERELDEELQFHMAMTEREQLERGASAGSARRHARVEFGSVDRFKEEYRDVTGTRALEDVLQDVRYAVRSLARAPAFAAAVVFTLALGIGAVTAMYSVVDGVLVRPLPYAAADRLVRVWQNDRNSGTVREPSAVPDYFDYLERSRAFEVIAGHWEQPVNLSSDGTDAARLRVLSAAPQLFPLLGTRLVHGRWLADSDVEPDARPVALVSSGLWQARFGGVTDVIGRTVELDGIAHLIVGVVARGHEYPDAGIDVWVPLPATPTSHPRYSHIIDVTARRAPGVTLEQAQADMTRIMAELEAEYAASNAGRGAFVEPLTEVMFGRVRTPLVALMVGVLLLLGIAAANAAGLLVARGAARAREVAVRASLGAAPGRLARQFLTEMLTLVAMAGALGTVLGWIGLQALASLVPPDVPRAADIHMDLRVLAFTALLSAAVGIAFGLLPALQARRVTAADALRGGSRTGGGVPRAGLRRALVTAQVALCVTLLVSATLVVRSFSALTAVDPGFRTAQLLKVQFQLPTTRYPRNFDNYPAWPEVTRFYREALAAAAAVPGVQSVALAAHHPAAEGFANSFVIVGREAEAATQAEIPIRPITAGYLATAGVRLIDGRDIEARDDAAAAPVLLINETGARTYFEGSGAIGRRIRFWGFEREIVGVISDERFAGLDRPAPPALYTPILQTPMHNASLLIRTAAEPAAVTAALRERLRDVDPGVALFGIETLDQTVAAALGRERFTALLLAVFAGAALLLAVVGVHGLISYMLARRTHEVGVRAALGARPLELGRMFVGEGLRLAATGIVLGLAAGAAASTLLRSILFGVSARDPLSYAVTAATMLGVALLAAWLPARRATRISPLEAVRTD